jgi:uncharacterized protein
MGLALLPFPQATPVHREPDWTETFNRECQMKDGIFRLLLKHQRIDAQLRLEQARRVPDTLRINQLKKMKLAVKDRLHRLSLGSNRPAFG